MPILIPSEKIYSIEHSKIVDNNISLAEQSLNNIIEKKGNILSKEYTFNFLEYDPKQNTFITLYYDTENTEGFVFEEYVSGTDTRVKSNITLSIGQNSYILSGYDVDGDLAIFSHYLVIKRIYSSTGTDRREETESKIDFKLTNITSDSISLDVDFLISSSIVGPTFKLLSATITVVGNYITLGETEEEKTGSGNKVFSLPSNELIQKTNDNISTIPNVTIESYKDGKETAKILCSIGEYYDENSEKVISTETSDKMTFEIDDLVIPMYNTAYGEAPLSTKEGNASIFQVVGTKLYFDGAVWQELTLQESGTFDGVIQNGSKGLTYEEIDGKLYCTGIGSCTDRNIKIASIVDGKEVYGIYYQAFKNNKKIVSVEIPYIIKSIGDEAFYYCENIKTVKIGNSVTSIGYKAFDYCIGLTSVEMGNGVNTIGDFAFYYCTGLTSFVIGDSVTEIGGSAFAHCENLISVKIPQSVTIIKSFAFERCYALENVYISDISKWCNISFGISYSSPFWYAKNLYLNNQLVTNLTIPYGVATISNLAFYGCSNITSVSLPSTLKLIGERSFALCGFRSLSLPSGVEKISKYAFQNCKDITSIVIPNSINSILRAAFYGCDSLSNVYYKGTKEEWNNIIIESYNDSLLNATIHFDS